MIILNIIGLLSFIGVSYYILMLILYLKSQKEEKENKDEHDD